MNHKLMDLIKYLISLKKEGEFWDYKEKWHKENERLIHDILCFANTYHDKDCLIIVGVTNDGEVKGLTENERKKQADLINLLNSYPFNEEPPSIELLNIEIFDGELIDVLIIKNSNKVPYFLMKRNKDYQKIKQGLIYSRIGDTNTPIDQGANHNKIELLWKKRFGINKTGLERFSDLLDSPSDWVSNECGYYHSVFTDYALKYQDSEYPKDRTSVFYSYTMYNKDTSFEMVELEVNGRALKEIELVTLDSGRYVTPSPEWGYIKFSFNDVFDFKYFVKGDLKYKLHNFFIDEDSEDGLIAYRNFSSVVLFFNSLDEKKHFINFLYQNEKIFKERMKLKEGDYVRTDNAVFQRQLRTGEILKQMLEDFRKLTFNS
ncbi:ATP-binding protein [Bacillus sp. 205(2023)]|uniref:ATP-binding protein n=1 Tax=Bacillus sp. 205(2023) TaxID=3096767 RepID=UPI003008405F